jgi:F0F1-type ATP synthase delta subunit
MIKLLARKQKARNFARAFLRCVNIEREGKKILAAVDNLLQSYKRDSLALHILEMSSAHIDQKCEAVAELCKKLSIPDSLCRLLQTLVRYKEFGLLVHLLPILRDEIKKRQGVHDVEVASSHPLTDEQKKAVEAAVSKHIPGTGIFSYKEDRSLIKGIRIKSAYYYWEESIARTLRQMRQKLYTQE